MNSGNMEWWMGALGILLGYVFVKIIDTLEKINRNLVTISENEYEILKVVLAMRDTQWKEFTEDK